eukprot:1053205-Alexandrium_andersonii.AAC.1
MGNDAGARRNELGGNIFARPTRHGSEKPTGGPKAPPAATTRGGPRCLQSDPSSQRPVGPTTGASPRRRSAMPLAAAHQP